MTNAVEHGNLGISYDEKTQLNNEGRWQEEVERRLCLPENLGKYALLKLEQGPTELRITIRDQGPGFDWENYLQISPERVFDNHGRGIAMAGAVSFDRIEYRGNGNEVVGFVMK
jgi:hypothetical protein